MSSRWEPSDGSDEMRIHALAGWRIRLLNEARPHVRPFAAEVLLPDEVPQITGGQFRPAKRRTIRMVSGIWMTPECYASRYRDSWNNPRQKGVGPGPKS